MALARECAQSHKSVLLLEKDDFGSGTTSRCSRIVQGGLRCLESGEIGMLRESLRGREALLREQSHLVHPLDFIIATDARSRYSTLETRTALWLYRRLGRVPRTSAEGEIESLRRSLDVSQRWALYPFQEAQCEFPERLVADWLLDACATGVIARNHAEVRAIQTSEGRVQGVLVRDGITGEDSYVATEWVINAAGPWTDVVREMADLATSSRLVSGVRSSHLMLRRFSGAPTGGLLVHSPDGRPLTLFPWNGMLQVGSTGVLHRGDLSLAEPTVEEIAYLLGSAASLFPKARITADDMVFSYAGVRPLAYRKRKSELEPDLDVAASRYVVHNHADEGALGMLSMFGGTLTTAASLARKTALIMGLQSRRQAGAPVDTEDKSKMESTLQQWASTVHLATGIPQASAEAVARWHGRYAMSVIQAARHDPVLRTVIVDGQPQIVAQAVEAVVYEHAVTLGDILLRRVPIALSQEWNEYRTAQAAARIAPALGWNEHRTGKEIEAFEKERSQFLFKPKDLRRAGVAA